MIGQIKGHRRAVTHGHEAVIAHHHHHLVAKKRGQPFRLVAKPIPSNPSSIATRLWKRAVVWSTAGSTGFFTALSAVA